MEVHGRRRGCYVALEFPLHPALLATVIPFRSSFTARNSLSKIPLCFCNDVGIGRTWAPPLSLRSREPSRSYSWQQPPANGTFPGPRCLDRLQQHPSLASSRNIAKPNPLGSWRIWTSNQRAFQPWSLHCSLTRDSGGTHPTIYMRSRVRLPISDYRSCQRV